MATDDPHQMTTYLRQPLTLVRGEGTHVFDDAGKSYLDWVSGIAVTNLGHCPEPVVDALVEQARTLWHVSNLYHTLPQRDLSEFLTEHSFADAVFFSNSGAEANEAALKLARKRANDLWGPGRTEVITTHGSFHGRTFATLAATGQEKVHTGFHPLFPGFVQVPYGDLDSAALAIGPGTAAILVEPIQGEGGVVMPPPGYLEGLRELADEHDLTLIFDEVQVGMGRAGALLAHERLGVTPDVATLAKALGSGIPIGATLASKKIADHFTPGTHGSTFGGNPLACAAALATLREMERRDLFAHVQRMEGVMRAGLEAIVEAHPAATGVRGMGLIFALTLAAPGAAVVDACRERGLLINCTQGSILRFLPALVTDEAGIREGLAIVADALASVTAPAA